MRHGANAFPSVGSTAARSGLWRPLATFAEKVAVNVIGRALYE